MDPRTHAVGVEAHLQFQLQKVETEGAQSKTASKTSHINEIWFNLRNKANSGITWKRARG